jgi:hypothetical protein
MRSKNPVSTERAQISLSENANRILEEVAEIGILGKTKAEVAGRIITDWIWGNEDRLSRHGIKLRAVILAKPKRRK